MITSREDLRHAKRIVVKVGSSTLTREGEIKRKAFTKLAAELSKLIGDKRQGDQMFEQF